MFSTRHIPILNTLGWLSAALLILLAACAPTTIQRYASAEPTRKSTSDAAQEVLMTATTENTSEIPSSKITATPPLPGVETSIRYIYLVPMSHLDIGFTAPADAIAEQYKPNLDLALKYLGVFPTMSWNIENLWQLEQWLERTDDAEGFPAEGFPPEGFPPEALKKLEEFIQARRLNLMAGYATMHSGMLSPAEWQHFLYPARTVEEMFSIQLTTAVQNDVPGYSWALPQVLHRGGIRYFITGPNISAGGGGTTIPLKDNPFYWEGSDGSRVLTWISPDNYSEGLFVYKLNQKINEVYLKQALEKLTDAGYPYDAILVQYAFDNQDADQLNIYQLVQNVEEWNKSRRNPRLLLAPPEDFFRHMEETYGDSFAVYRGDWSGLWEQTKILSPAGTALIRKAKDNLLSAETLYSIATAASVGIDAEEYFRPEVLFRIAFPGQQVDELYLDILYYDEHSTGSIVPWPGLMTEEEVNHDNTIHLELAQTIFSDSQGLLSAGWEILAPMLGGEQPSIVVFNPLSWVRSGVVPVQQSTPGMEDWNGTIIDEATGEEVAARLQEDGTLLILAVDVPAMGYRRYLLKPGEAAAGMSSSTTQPVQNDQSAQIGEVMIENSFYRLTVDAATGSVISLWDSTNQREVLNPTEALPFNALLRASHKSTFLLGDFDVVNEAESSPENVSVEVVVENADSMPVALSQTIIVRREGAIFAETRYHIEPDQPWVEVTNLLDRTKMPYVPESDHSDLYYFAFPFHIPSENLTLHLETAGGFLNPAQDLLPGANGRGFSVQNVSAMVGSDGAEGYFRHTALLTQHETFLIFVNNVTRSGPFQGVDRPMLIAGAMAAAHEGSTKDKGVVPLVGGEPSAPSIHTFTYRLSTQSAGFDAVNASRLGWEAQIPLLAAMLPAASESGMGSPLPALGSFFWLDAPSVMIAELKGATFGDPGDIILRLQEVSGEPVEVTLNSAFTIQEAFIASVTEDAPVPFQMEELVVEEHRITLQIPGNGLITLRLKLTGLAAGQPTVP